MLYTIDASGIIYLREISPDEAMPKIIIWFEEMYRRGIIISTEKVRQELIPGEDQLTEWAINRPAFFERTSRELEQERIAVHEATYQEAREKNHSEQRVSAFFKGADTYLIAHAIITNACVVTEEAPLKRGKIQIPQVCKRMGVRCINTDTMLAELDPEYSEVPLSIVRRRTDSVNPS